MFLKVPIIEYLSCFPIFDIWTIKWISQSEFTASKDIDKPTKDP